MSRLTDEQICALAKKIVSNAPFTGFDVECMNIIKTDDEAWQDLFCAMSVYKITGNLGAFAVQPLLCGRKSGRQKNRTWRSGWTSPKVHRRTISLCCTRA